MALTNYLAELWGISMVIIALALLVKDKHIRRLFESIENEEGLFMWGFISLVIGISMILAHNIWVQGWPVIITLLGWASLIKGLTLLFVPEMVKKWTKKVENAPFLPYALIVAVIIGLIITYLGFRA